MVRFFRSKKVLKDRDWMVEFMNNMSVNILGSREYEVYVPEPVNEKFKKFEKMFKEMEKDDIRLKNELDKILEEKKNKRGN